MTDLFFKDLIDYLNARYPQDYAEDWDKVGLHFGHINNPVKRVMVALDLRPQVVAEALEQKIDTLILHHPPIFHAIDRFDWSDPQIKMYQTVIQAGMNVFAMHTNYDAAPGGMNDILAQALRLEAVQPFKELVEGQVAIGRVGLLPQALTRHELFAYIKQTFKRSSLTVIEKVPRASYQKIAIVGGAGASFMDQVERVGPDVFITGDISYHTGHDLYEKAFMTIDAGHYIEHLFIDVEVARIQKHVAEKGWDIEVIASSVSTDPFTYQ
ncbi:Nif3-like dinuclear metal center hexameric protein [Facklamia miroungae]|uniref:GTP cyclohydrolase 1 type 2 homolog n=1 Tax=Facklamia miroungae TaxID=120956 RepID=A0A1G7PL38_9LACT|nr:Nif3-like dinuclear metal center hexameric protein [Facklamia miroungae]NKZ28733.1 Nif3-like dinuclear metal center hexameric protein [Facklamia miroungae]SDF86349.1 dinuclear metal center protein, YbgI/SA1388 family [Facklamia miroungae]